MDPEYPDWLNPKSDLGSRNIKFSVTVLYRFFAISRARKLAEPEKVLHEDFLLRIKTYSIRNCLNVTI